MGELLQELFCYCSIISPFSVSITVTPWCPGHGEMGPCCVVWTKVFERGTEALQLKISGVEGLIIVLAGGNIGKEAL